MSNDYRTVLDYLNTTPECDAFYDAVNALDRMHATPVNPGATQALVTALRAILRWDEVRKDGDGDLPSKLINDANNALHMAQLPSAGAQPVRRYAFSYASHKWSAGMEEDTNGKYVLFEDYFSLLDELGEANASLAAAKAPVVPVSEDVHLRLGPCRCHDCARARSEDVETIRKELQNDPLWMEFQTNALAALDRLAAAAQGRQHADICGLCGNQGADKLPQMTYWPGERIPNKGRLVHKKCEDEERNRAFDALTPDEIADSFPS